MGKNMKKIWKIEKPYTRQNLVLDVLCFENV